MSDYVPTPLEQQILQQWGRYGDWNVKGVNRARELADLLSLHGVTSLDKITPTNRELTEEQRAKNAEIADQLNRASVADPEVTPSNYTTESDLTSWGGYRTGPQWQIGDKVLGFLGDYNLDSTYGSKASPYMQDSNRVGWSARGEGNVSYSLKQNPRTGEYYIAPDWGSSSDLPEILPIVQAGLMFVPGVGQALGTALGATGIGASALGNAIISGTMAELGGGDFLKGAAAGGLGSLGGQFIAPVAGQIGGAFGEAVGSELIGDALTKGLTNAATSGIRATVSDRDISDALLSGFVGGSVSSGIGDLVGEYFGDLPDFITSTGSKLLSDYLTSEILSTNRPNATQTVIDSITRPGATGGAPSGTGGMGGMGGMGGTGGMGGMGGMGGLETLLMLPMLMQGQQNQQESQQAPVYASTLRSPFGSILG